MLVGLAEGDRIDVNRMIARWHHPRYASVRASLAEVGFHSVIDLLATFAGTPRDLAHWLEGAEINADINMRLQYLAGTGLNLYQNAAIYDRMIVRGLRFPTDLFAGSADVLTELGEKIEQRQGRS